MSKKIGILALQGGYAAHARICAKLNVPHKLIYKPNDLAQVDGLIIPGGESTTLVKLLKNDDMAGAIVDFAQTGRGILGTCAGSILLGQCQVDKDLKSLALMDMQVERNAYGRQIDSFIAEGELETSLFSKPKQEMVFIRAPQIKYFSDKVKPIAWCKDQVVMVQQDNLFAATFHPELSIETQIHAYFIAC